MTQELFKFFWTIENVTDWDYNRFVDSPTFVVNELGNCEFYLSWNAKGNTQGKCSLNLHRSLRDGSPDEVKLKFRLKMPKERRAQTTSEDVSLSVNHTSHEFPDYIANNRILQTDNWGLLSGDVHIECTILKPEVGVGVPLVRASRGFNDCVECFAITRIRTKTISVNWKVENFSRLRTGEKATAEIFFPPEDSPRYRAEFSLGDSPVTEVQLDIKNLKKLDTSPTYVACKVTLGEDWLSKIVWIVKHVFTKENRKRTWRLAFPVQEFELADKRGIIQSDVLPILLEFKIETGLDHSRMDKTTCKLVS